MRKVENVVIVEKTWGKRVEDLEAQVVVVVVVVVVVKREGGRNLGGFMVEAICMEVDEWFGEGGGQILDVFPSKKDT